MKRLLDTFLVLSFCLCPFRAPGAEPWGRGESEVVISEVHYHPSGDEKSEEFIELHNAGISWVDLGGWKIDGLVTFEFQAGTVLGPGAYLVVAREAAALRKARGIDNVAGDWKGNLKNSGGFLRIVNRTGRTVASLHYRDGHGARGGLWPESPDGDGPSLELIDPQASWHRPWFWAPSQAAGGTPGRENSRWRRAGKLPAPQDSGPKLNEFALDGPHPFVEIASDSTAPVQLAGVVLTFAPLDAGGLALTGSVARSRFHVVDGEALAKLLASAPPEPAKKAAGEGGEGDSGKDGKAPRSGSRRRGRLFLLAAESREILDSLPARGPAPAGGSFGRFPDATGDFQSSPRATPGAANAAPAARDVVIHELHYHSATGEVEEEFVELHNRGKNACDLAGWRLERAVSFTFPAGASIPAGGFAVVARDPKKIRGRMPGGEAAAGAGSPANLHGPFQGKLANSGDVIVLSDAAGDEVDRVEYSDQAPWPPEGDGTGFSIELIDPALDNRWGQAWIAGGTDGSPGRKGARPVKTMPPAVAGVRHDPPIPGPEDAVVIHAHVLDTGGVSSVNVVYRDASGRGAATRKAMADTGKLEDGAARDGHYTARLPRFRAGTLIGFMIVARDASGRDVRAPETGEYYFQVEAPEREEVAGMPVYRVLMPPEAWASFQQAGRGNAALFPCTLIAGVEGAGVNRRKGQAFYEAKIRHRGQTSQGRTYRLRIDGGGRFDGRDRFIVSTFNPLQQKVAADVLRLAGVPTSNADPIRLKTPGFDDARWVDLEVVNNEFLDDKFGSSAGDLHRGERAGVGSDLALHGTDPAGYLAAYPRVNKKSDRDVTKLLRLLRALDVRDRDQYPAKVEEVIDPEEWVRYFAANNILGNTEGGLSTDYGDDYFLAERPDGKFVLVPWDQNETFNELDQKLFRPSLPAVRRFLQHPKYAPLYHRAIREVLDGPFSRAAITRSLAGVAGTYPPAQLARILDFAVRRQNFLREQYALNLGARVLAPEDGGDRAGFGSRTFLAGGAAEITVEGVADPALAFSLRVAGTAADYDPIRGRWTWQGAAGSFASGPNALWVEYLGPGQEPAFVYPINVERVETVTAAQPAISGNAEWKEGVVFLRGPTVIEAGATLRIQAGADIVCGPGAFLLVRGTLLAGGTPTKPITFRPADGERSWHGLRFLRAGTSAKGSVLSHVRFEGGEGAAVGAETAVPAAPPEVRGRRPAGSRFDHFLHGEGGKLSLDHVLFRDIHGTAIGMLGTDLELGAVRIADSRSGVAVTGGKLVVRGLELSRLHGEGAVFTDVKGAKIEGLHAREVAGAGVAVEGGDLALENGLLQGCGTALAATGKARVKVSRMTFAGNVTALAVDAPRLVLEGPLPPRRPPPRPGGRGPVVILPPAEEGALVPPEGKSHVEITQSVLGPQLEVLAAGGALPVVADTLLAPGGGAAQLLKGQGLIVESPRFRAPRAGDFRLEKDSPGAGKGAGGADLGYAGR